ncbi:MAG: hypothetical protein IJ100_11190, partial [Lachnospiraceae bacterium]|nr:hypothetical protein [Lachnospiraceae bacterium]
GGRRKNTPSASCRFNIEQHKLGKIKCRKLGKIVCRISGKINAVFSGKVLAVYNNLDISYFEPPLSVNPSFCYYVESNNGYTLLLH